MQGRDLRPLMESPEREWRDEIFLESLFLLRTGPYMEAVRSKKWKYVRYFRSDKAQYTASEIDFAGMEPAFEQLFDLVNDPEEENNLAADPKHAELLDEYRQLCRRYSESLVEASKDTQTYPR